MSALLDALMLVSLALIVLALRDVPSGIRAMWRGDKEGWSE